MSSQSFREAGSYKPARRNAHHVGPITLGQRGRALAKLQRLAFLRRKQPSRLGRVWMGFPHVNNAANGTEIYYNPLVALEGWTAFSVQYLDPLFTM